MKNRLGSSLLLKPARDLEQNWDIDVASELEAYLTQVEEQVTKAKESVVVFGDRDADEDDRYHINFVEAALMLQSGTSVYSKKVEYLLALTYKTLSRFSGSLKLNGNVQELLSRRTGKPVGRRKGRTMEDWDCIDGFFCPWSVVVDCEEKSGGYLLDVVKPHEGCQSPYVIYSSDHYGDQPKKMEHKLKQIESVESLSQSRLSHIPLLLVPRDDRSEMRVTSLLMHPMTGVLVVDPRDALCRYQEGDVFDLPLEDTKLAHRSHLLASNQPLTTPFSQRHETPKTLSCAHIATADRRLESSVLAERTSITGNDPRSVDVTQSSAQGNTTSLLNTYDLGVSTCTTTERAQHRSRFAHHPLQRLDCHQQLGRAKPQKIGSTVRQLSKDVFLSSCDKLNSEQLVLFLQLQRRSFMGSRWCCNAAFEPVNKLTDGPRTVPTFPDIVCPPLMLADRYMLGPTWCFAEAYYTRSSFRSTHSIHATSSEAPRTGTESNLSERLNVPSRFEDDSEMRFYDEDPEEREPLSDHEDLDPSKVDDIMDSTCNVDEDIDFAVLQHNALSSDSLHRNLDDSVSRMCSLDGSITSEDRSGLRQRVAQWRHNVERWMTVINASPVFDVAKYKRTLSDILLGKQRSGTVQTDFNDLVFGCKRSEVCRYFLTTMMLCDEQFITLQTSAANDLSIVLRNNERRAPETSKGLCDHTEKDEARTPSHNRKKSRRKQREKRGTPMGINDK